MSTRRFLTGRFVLLPLILTLAVAGGASLGAASDAQTTIDAIAATLARLGDGALGTRLQADFTAGRVLFGEVDGTDTAHVRAGWFGYGGSSTNWMTIRSDQERAGRVNPSRRWNPQSSGLVALASTMVHEYVHMGQLKPRNEPAWEDPAYREQEAAVGRWIKRLSAEVDAFVAQPPGAARTAGVRETADLLRLIRSDCGDMADASGAIVRAARRGAITAGRSWQYKNYVALIDRQLRRIEGLEPTVAAEWLGANAARPAVAVVPPAGGGPTGAIPRGGAWVLSSADVSTDNPGLDQQIQEYASSPARVQGSILPGVSRFTWINPAREGSPTTSLAVTWSVPDVVPLSGEFVVKVTASDTGSAANAGEGDFVSFSLGLWGSDDGANWSMKAGNFPALYASPRKTLTETYRVPAPANKVALLHLNVSTGNIHWGKLVRYQYKWKDGPQ